MFRNGVDTLIWITHKIYLSLICRWYDLILQCRTSGLSDRQWLEENNVSSPTFYYHLKQLRKKACESQLVHFQAHQLIIPELSEPPVRTLGATIPENESHIFR